MTTENTSASSPNSVTPPVPIHVTPSGLKGLKLFEREIATYRRELPRLLQEGETGRYALVKGDEILSIWDSWGCHAGRLRTVRPGYSDICQTD